MYHRRLHVCIYAHDLCAENAVKGLPAPDNLEFAVTTSASPDPGLAADSAIIILDVPWDEDVIRSIHDESPPLRQGWNQEGGCERLRRHRQCMVVTTKDQLLVIHRNGQIMPLINRPAESDIRFHPVGQFGEDSHGIYLSEKFGITGPYLLNIDLNWCHGQKTTVGPNRPNTV